MTTDTAVPATTPAFKIAEYNPVAASLAELRQRFAGVAYDLTTTKGDREARQARKELVTLRTSLEAKRKELKAPALERSRLIDAEAKAITEAILDLETPIDEQIKADEKRREDERQAKAKAEAARIAAIQTRIGMYGGFIFRASGQPSSEILELICELEADKPDEVFQEFLPAAQAAYENARNSLQSLFTRTAAQENETVRLAEERKRLEAEAAAIAKAKADEEARAAAARQAEEARQQAQRDAQEAQLRAEREAEAARLAEIRRQQEDELQRQREAEEIRWAEERRQAEAEAAAERQRIADEQAELDRRIAAQEAEERQKRDEREAAEAQARAERERLDAAERDRKMAEQRAEMERVGRLHGASERMLQALLAVRLHVMAWEDGTLADGDQLAQYVGDEIEPAIAAATAMPGTPPAAVMAELPNGE